MSRQPKERALLSVNKDVVKLEIRYQQDVLTALHSIDQLLVEYCDNTVKNNGSYARGVIQDMLKNITADPFMKITSITDLIQYGLPLENQWMQNQLIKNLWNNKERSTNEKKEECNDTVVSEGNVNEPGQVKKNTESAKKILNNTVLENESEECLQNAPMYKWKHKAPYVTLMGRRLIHSMLELTVFKWDVKVSTKIIKRMMHKIGYSRWNITCMIKDSNKAYQRYNKNLNIKSFENQMAFEIDRGQASYSIKWRTETIRNWFVKRFVDSRIKKTHTVPALIPMKRARDKIEHYQPATKKRKIDYQSNKNKDDKVVQDKLAKMYDKLDNMIKEIDNMKKEIDNILSS